MSEKKQFRLSVISLWMGILIPILAALIPYAAKYVLPEHRLEYTITGLVSVKEPLIKSRTILYHAVLSEERVNGTER